MKRIVSLSVSEIFLISLIGCSGDLFSESNKEREQRHLNERKKRYKELLLPDYSDERVITNVISQREAMDILLDRIFGVDYEKFYEEYKRLPDLKDVKTGDLILVQNFLWQSIRYGVYHYIFTGTLNNWIRVEGGIHGVENSSMGDPAKEEGNYLFLDKRYLPHRYLSKWEAIVFLKEKFSIGNEVTGKIKAVIPNRDPYQWGWAVKFDKYIDLKPYYNIDVRTNVFWLNSAVYDETWVDPDGEDSTEVIIQQRYARAGRIGYFDKDPFDPKVLREMNNFIFQDFVYENNLDPEDYYEYFKKLDFYFYYEQDVSLKEIIDDLIETEEYREWKNHIDFEWNNVAPVLTILEPAQEERFNPE